MGLFATAASKSKPFLAARANERCGAEARAQTETADRSDFACWSVAAELESAADLLWARVREQAARCGRRCLLVAHWGPGEGASTVAAALAARAAELNGMARICLADFDFFGAGLSKLIGLNSRPGLADVVADSVPPDAALVPTRWHNLHVLPAGQPPLGQKAACHFQRCRQLVEQLSLDFDWLLLDGPALRDHQNCSLWAGELAVSLLVVRAGEARKQAVAKAARILRLMDLPPVALALNRRRYYIPQWLYKRT